MSPALALVLLNGSVSVAFVVVRPMANSPVGLGSGNSVKYVRTYYINYNVYSRGFTVTL